MDGAKLAIDWTHSRDWLVVLGPGDHSRGMGLHLADEGGILVQQDVHGLKEGDDLRCWTKKKPNNQPTKKQQHKVRSPKQL